MVGLGLVVALVAAVVVAVVARGRFPNAGRVADLLAYVSAAVVLVGGVVAYTTVAAAGASPGLAVVLTVAPVGLSLPAAAARRLPASAATLRWACAAALLVFVAVTGLSVGLFFAPGALVVLASAVAQATAAEDVSHSKQ